MSDLNLNFDTDNKKINVDSNGKENTSLNIKQDNSSAMLGVELLANQNSKADLNVTTNNTATGYSSGEESVKSTKKEDFDFFNDTNNESNIKTIISPATSPLPDNPEVKNINTSPVNDPLINDAKGAESGEFKPVHAMNSQDIKNEKIDLIYKFKKLEGQGIRTTMNYNMNSQLEDMRNEYLKLKKQREVESSIKFQRKVMMALITGAEYLNNRFDPFDIKLDGWSESVNENITDYDEVFEELAEKYGGKSEMAPEIKLLMMLGGSAFMFHLTNTMFKSSIPGMNDIMRQNPDLMKQFAQAAVGSIGKQDQPREPPQMRTDIPPPQMQHSQQPQQTQQQPPPRPEMSGPAGIDDIINQMNLQPNSIPDLDNISLMSGDTDKKSNSGITLNL